MRFFSREPVPKVAMDDFDKKDIKLDHVFTPIEHPASGTISQPEVPNDKTVPDEEKRKRFGQVLEHFQNDELEYSLRTDDDTKVKLSLLEKAWLTKECFYRYLRGCNWDVDETIKRLENSIVWRREYGIANSIFGDRLDPKWSEHQIKELIDTQISPEKVVEESLTGKQLIIGFDHGCRPCLYLYNGRGNTKPSDTQIQFLIFMLECAISYMPQGQDKLTLCVDFQDFPDVGIKTPIPSLHVGTSVLHILQYHYPERLGRALFVNIPFVASVFLKLCWPFLDPYTKQKTSFDNPFSKFIPGSQLIDMYEGGDIKFRFDHEKYWKGLIDIGVKKYSLYLERFVELGGTVGLSEVDLRLHEKVPGSEVMIESVVDGDPGSLFVSEDDLAVVEEKTSNLSIKEPATIETSK